MLLRVLSANPYVLSSEPRAGGERKKVDDPDWDPENLDKLCGIAIARLGLNFIEFYELTPIEFSEAVNQKSISEEFKTRLEYDVARYTVRHLWNMQGRHVKRLIKTVKEVDVFPWEKEEERKNKKPQTLDEMKSELKSIYNIFKKKKNEHRQTDSNHRRRH